MGNNKQIVKSVKILLFANITKEKIIVKIVLVPSFVFIIEINNLVKNVKEQHYANIEYKKYDGYCVFCFINLFPDKEISINYKRKRCCGTN
jgi:hypothetical protein